MKYINIVLSLAIIATILPAMTPKTKEVKLLKGTSIGKYTKPGAPVNIRYTSEHVAIGEVSRVEIVLFSSEAKGMMDVKVKVDENLNELTNVDKKFSFNLRKVGEEHSFYLEVSAEEDGLYYMRILVSIEGKGMRAFAVPIHVGTGKVIKNKANINKTKSGENISIFSAEETIIK